VTSVPKSPLAASDGASLTARGQTPRRPARNREIAAFSWRYQKSGGEESGNWMTRLIPAFPSAPVNGIVSEGRLARFHSLIAVTPTSERLGGGVTDRLCSESLRRSMSVIHPRRVIFAARSREISEYRQPRDQTCVPRAWVAGRDRSASALPQPTWSPLRSTRHGLGGEFVRTQVRVGG
jgi:hypothetical protein